MKKYILIVLALLLVCASFAYAARGYRFVCHRSGHGTTEVLGPCRSTVHQARQDMQLHANRFHRGYTGGMTDSGGCNL